MSFGLPQKTITQLKSVFKKYPELTQVKIYGSRVTNIYRRGSDIDLAFFSESEKDLLPNLSWELDDLPSPYLFDLVNYNTLNDSPLKQEIDRYGKVLYKKSSKVRSSVVQEKPLLKKQPFFHKLETRGIKTPKADTSFAFKQTDIGEIPKDWEISSVDEKYNFSKKPKDLDFNNFKTISFIPMDMIPNDKIILDSYVKKKPENISSGVYFESGDLLLSKITPSFENGKQCIVKNIEHGFGIATTEAIPIKEKNGRSDIRLLFYYLLLNNIRSQIAEKMEGATGRKRVPVQVIKNLKIPFPSLPEQKKIIAVLSQIQEAIEIQDKLVEVTKELKQSTMKQLFTYGVKGQKTKQTEIGEIPENWDISILGNICKKPEYGFTDTARNSGSVRFIRITDIEQSGEITETNKKFIDVSTHNRKYLLQNDDLLVARTGATFGKTALFDKKYPAIFASYLIRLNFLNTDILPKYYWFFSQSKLYWNQAYNLVTGGSQPQFNSNAIQQIKIPYPPFSEQEEIA